METPENIIRDSYRSISGPAEGLFKDNGSRFISFAFPIETEDEVKSIVGDLKKNTTTRDIIATPTAWAISGTGSGPTTTGSLPPPPADPFSDRSTPRDSATYWWSWYATSAGSSSASPGLSGPTRHPRRRHSKSGKRGEGRREMVPGLLRLRGDEQRDEDPERHGSAAARPEFRLRMLAPDMGAPVRGE